MFKSKIHKFDLLVGLYITCLLLAEIMGGKVFTISDDLRLFGRPLSASVGLFLIPILFSVNDVITEVYGKERARSVIRTGLMMLIFLVIFSLVAIVLPISDRSPVSQDIFSVVFSKSIRMALASLTAFAISEFLDVFVFVKVREILGTKKLWLRNNVSNFVAQFIDTVTFMFLAFYSIDKSFLDNFGFLFSLIIPYWLLKCFMSVIETPFVYMGIKWLKNGKKEK